MYVFLALIFSTVLSNCASIKKKIPETNSAKLLEVEKQIIRTQIDGGQPHKAISHLRNLIRKHPTDMDLRTLNGFAFIALRQLNPALKNMIYVFKRKKDISSGLNLSSTYIELKKFRKARKLLKYLLKKNKHEMYPYPERLFHNLALTYHLQKNFRKAKKYYKRALEENPSFYLSILQLARVYEKLNNSIAALRTYRMASENCMTCFQPIKGQVVNQIKMRRNVDAFIVLNSFLGRDGLADIEKQRAMKLLRNISKRPKRNPRQPVARKNSIQ